MNGAAANGNRPMPGDAVMIWNSNDCLVKDRTIGIIEGMIGDCRDAYLVCFNDHTFRDDETVSASGGPAYRIDTVRLKPSNRVVNKLFWKWRDVPRAGGGEYYYKSCRVWILNKGAAK